MNNLCVNIIIDSDWHGWGFLRLTLRPIRKYALPDTYSEGFVFVGKERIMDKILYKKLPL